ncbi:MAG: hypothetical protein Edafosvirus14_25 [Edafosvirus sp.]|uniref:Uncharacterized protein n=1 Tax=Edafosvirus sp. TaxID=2487765 RepID=A0A3G4ZU97_9VIRU|nr:MAG: hypothetical protein Edafosvirus14_25 [Edafosvirus sp.]
MTHEDISLELLIKNQLECCVFHSDIFPKEHEIDEILIYPVEHNYDGFDIEQKYKFVWDHKNNICYDNCNYNGRMEKWHINELAGQQYKKEKKQLYEDLKIKIIELSKDLLLLDRETELSKNILIKMKGKLGVQKGKKKNDESENEDIKLEEQILKNYQIIETMKQKINDMKQEYADIDIKMKESNVILGQKIRKHIPFIKKGKSKLYEYVRKEEIIDEITEIMKIVMFERENKRIIKKKGILQLEPLKKLTIEQQKRL